MKKIFLSLFLGFFLFSLHTVSAAPMIPWSAWVAQLKEEAVSEGISPSLFDQLFAGMNGPS